MSEKFYLAGPMSGHPDFNYPAFDKAVSHFRGKNMEVLSPHELHGADTSMPYEFYMKGAIGLLIQCTAILLLPGWQLSRGATLEEAIAHACNMHIFHVAPGYRLARARGRGNQDATTFTG